MIGIYKITSPTGKVYIGQSVNIEKRFTRYRSLDCKEQPKIYRSFLKYGVIKHKFEVICECSVEDLNNKEREYQELYKSVENGLNCNYTESSLKPRIVSSETIEKIRNIHLGRIDSPETRQKRAIAIKGLKRTEAQRKKMSESAIGRKLTKEHKENISKSGLGRVFSQETRQKMSFSKKGRYVSPETREKLSIINKNRCDSINKKMSNSLKGRIHSEETRLKMSISHKNRFLNIPKKEKTKTEPKKRKVICLKTNVVYNSLTECAKLNGFKRTTLQSKLSGINSNNTSFVYLNS